MDVYLHILAPKNVWNSLQPPKTELIGHQIQGCHEISVMSQIFKFLSRPHITSKYGVSYTVGKVLQSTLRICKVWVTKPNYLVARGLWRLKNGEKICFGGFEAVRGHIPMRSKVILKAPWVMVLTQPPQKNLLDILLWNWTFFFQL